MKLTQLRKGSKMKLSKYVPGARRARYGAASVATLVALFSAGLLVALVGGAQAASSAVPLGTADSFAVLAGAGITNTGPTTVSGDLGTFPTTTIVGAASVTINGTNHGGDGVTQQAKTDLVTAFNNAAGQGPTSPIAGDLGGQTLKAGVYKSSSSIGLTGALTLDAAGDPSAVFVFQAGSTLTTASGSSVNLINGAQSCNVFWEIGSSATLGTGSSFRGTIIAQTSITVTTAATVDGRVLARDGAVTLDTNTITKPTCSAAATTSTAATTTAATTTAATTTAATTTAATTTAATTTATTTTTPTVTTPKKPAPVKKPVPKKPAKIAAATHTLAHPAVAHVGLTG
jgi:hypothetical protein